ncbi:MAG: hypothetical protein ACOX1S_05375 [Anaerostipes sp.]|jgi:hypothetical protein|nr:hypothetical protein [Anaerostipes sp.]
MGKAGRPNKKQMLKKLTKETILSALKEKGNDSKYLLDQVDEYMRYFDNLDVLNIKLCEDLDIDLLKEKRQVTKEMRNILTFLGLKPVSVDGVITFEEL